ncbi:MAG: PilZ domain-containing protein [Candidatus Omnitrophota bacterium]
MEEKRKARRVEKAIIVQYAKITSEPLCWDSTTVKNISIDGILLNSNEPFVKNEKLQSRFVIPTDPFNRLEAVGEVIDSLAYRARIRFIDLGQKEKEAISNYVNCLIEKNKKNEY